MEHAILIKNGVIVTADSSNTIHEDGAILIRGKEIADLGPTLEVEERNPVVDKVIDAKKKAVIPGLIDAHTHSAILRGSAEGYPLFEWLAMTVDPMHKIITRELAHAVARLSYAESLRFGTTCSLNMYRHMEGSAEVAEEMGVRAVLAPYVADNPPYTYFETMEANERLIKEWHQAAEGRIRVWAGLEHMLYCTPAAYRWAVRTAERYQTGIHTHTNESLSLTELLTERLGHRPIVELKDRGILGPHTVLAHCVHLTPEELDLLAETSTAVAHCPTSNMKLSSGFAPIPELLQAGIRVGLGSDGSNVNNNLDLFEEMKIAILIQAGHRNDPLAVDLQSVFRMATINGARALGLGSLIGSLEKGKRADLVIVNLNTLHTTPLMKGGYNNVIPHLIYSSSGKDVEAVFVDGRQLMEDGKLLTVDEQEVIDRAQAAAEEIFKLKEPLIPRSGVLKPPAES